jgi:hypothetical protein
MGSKTDKISRRTSLAGATGMLVVGSGLGAVLTSTRARAGGAPTFVLRIHKHVDGKKKIVGTLQLPDELLSKLVDAGEGPIELELHEGSGPGKKVRGKASLQGASKVKDAIRKSKKKREK